LFSGKHHFRKRNNIFKIQNMFRHNIAFLCLWAFQLARLLKGQCIINDETCLCKINFASSVYSLTCDKRTDAWSDFPYHEINQELSRNKTNLKSLRIINKNGTSLTRSNAFGDFNYSEITLSLNFISSIDQRAFKGAHIQSLNLSHNQLSNLSFIESLCGLKELFLSYNQIYAIQNETFSHLSTLTILISKIIK
jgi:Leucine-rich repeat (LRR) protein